MLIDFLKFLVICKSSENYLQRRYLFLILPKLVAINDVDDIDLLLI